MSTFSGLSFGVSGLLAAQRAMDITGQNVINANSTGYSRQRVDLTAVGAPAAASLQTYNPNQIVGGVDSGHVSRVHDAFLEATRAAAGGRNGMLTAQADAMSAAEGLLTEPGDNGLQSVLDSFYSSWHDLSTTPDDAAAGAVVLNDGQAVADQLRATSNGLSDQWQNGLATMRSTLAEVNQDVKDLASLNSTIRDGVIAQHPVNELLDQRDQLTRKLAELSGAVTAVQSDGQVNVSIGGISVVAGGVAQQLTLDGAGQLPDAAGNPPTLRWNGLAVPVDSGTLAGQLGVLRTDLPGLSAQLDQVALAVRDSVNSVHSAGYTLAGATGTAFFSGTSAQDLAVVPTSTDQLAVAAAAGVHDGANATAIGDLADDNTARSVLSGPGASEQWRDLSAGLGVKVASLQRSSANQQAVAQTADAAAESDSGVSLDEEMSNMLLYQRAYQASARVISTVDSMLDTLINRTGV